MENIEVFRASDLIESQKGFPEKRKIAFKVAHRRNQFHVGQTL